MIKLLFVGRRAAGRTRFAAQRHLARVHGRMVVLPPADVGPMPVNYTQHHVLDGSYPAVAGAHGLERDLVTEFWFENVDHLRASTQTDYYLAYLSPDEPRFVDRASVEKLRVTPQLLRDGERGDYKLLLLLSRNSESDWDGAISRTVATLAEAGFGAIQRNDTMESPMGAPFVDVVLEAWHHDRSAPLAIADGLAGLPLAAATNFARSIALAVEVFPTERLRSLDVDAVERDHE